MISLLGPPRTASHAIDHVIIEEIVTFSMMIINISSRTRAVRRPRCAILTIAAIALFLRTEPYAIKSACVLAVWLQRVPTNQSRVVRAAVRADLCEVRAASGGGRAVAECTTRHGRRHIIHIAASVDRGAHGDGEQREISQRGSS